MVESIDDAEAAAAVAASGSNSKNIFVVAILRLLQETVLDPNKGEQFGIRWFDYEIFETNSRLLAPHLGIETNSLNTNFRKYGFEILLQFANRQWARRKSTLFAFTKSTTLEDAKNINVRCKNIPTVCQSLLHENVRTFEQPHLEHVMNQTYQNPDQVHEVGSEIATIWKSFQSGKTQKELTFAQLSYYFRIPLNEVPSMALALHFIAETQRLNPQSQSQIDQSTILSRTMNFSDFLLFFIRYGDPTDPFSVIRQLYSTDPNLRFIPGFRPDISQETARLFLSAEPYLENRKYWIVFHLRSYNAFCLLVRIDQNYQTNIKRYLIDHFLDSSNSIFKLQSTTGALEAKTLFSLLFDVLHFNPEDGFRIEQSFNDDFQPSQAIQSYDFREYFEDDDKYFS
jgi:hypothetical protein